MGGEQAAEAARDWVLDEERLHARWPVKAGVALDLLQRADQRVGLLGELGRAGIGQELARARQGEADEQGDAPADQDHGDRKGDRQQGCAAPGVAAAATPAAAPAVATACGPAGV